MQFENCSLNISSIWCDTLFWLFFVMLFKAPCFRNRKHITDYALKIYMHMAFLIGGGGIQTKSKTKKF